MEPTKGERLERAGAVAQPDLAGVEEPARAERLERAGAVAQPDLADVGGPARAERPERTSPSYTAHPYVMAMI